MVNAFLASREMCNPDPSFVVLFYCFSIFSAFPFPSHSLNKYYHLMGILHIEILTLDPWSNDHIRNDQDDDHDHDHDDHDDDDDDGDGDKDKASANIGLASASERPLQQIPAVANFENTIFFANF